MVQTLVFGKFIWYTAAAVGKHKRLLRPAPVISLPPQHIVLAGYVPQRGIANGSQPRLPYPILFTGTQNQVPASTPTFTPSGGATNSLSLLADIASRRRAEIGDANNTPQAVTDTLDQPGPYCPAMSAKVTKKILDLEFLEMSEITSEDPYLSETARPAVRPPIKDITLWVQKFSAMAAVLCSRYPKKAPELFAYQASIVRAVRNFEGDHWVSYDRQYRREALFRKDLDWSVQNSRLFNEAFTGCARPNRKCIYCVQDDHSSAVCLLNPYRNWVQWLQDTPPGLVPAVPHPPQVTQHHSPGLADPNPAADICRRYNRGSCSNQTKCKYRHVCFDCQGPHRVAECRHYHPNARSGYGTGRTNPYPRKPPAYSQS